MTTQPIADHSLRARLLAILSRPTLLAAAKDHARLMLKILERRTGR